MQNDFNFNELKTADRLPSPSGTVLAIMQLVRQEDVQVQRITQLIQTDPALTGRVLKLANSAVFAARRPILNVQDAMVMLGTQAVCNLVLSISLVGKYREGRCRSFNYSIYWSESLAVAVAIAALTARERTAPHEEAFVLGLLSGIGRLALATAWPDLYSECLEMAQGEQLIQLERDRFAADQRVVSLMLLADWGFPEIFRNALMQSFDPVMDESSRTARLAGQLAFARQIARYCLADDEYRVALLSELTIAANKHGLDDVALPKFIENIIGQWREWGILIDIKTDIRLPMPDVTVVKEAIVTGLELLLIDDDAIMLEELASRLSAVGHRVEVCRDGEAALKYIIEHKPQLVISDWRIKPMGGLQLCKALRAFEFGKNIYFIMLTSSETEDALVEAFDAGIDDYAVKPVNLRILLARIRAAQRIISLQRDLWLERKEIEAATAELAVANRRLEQMVNTDLLTQLPNRRYALKRLEQEWLKSQQFNRPLSVLMLDLDHFKAINDGLGHDIGDQVLAHAAKVMRETVRTNDVACRLGGEEFIIIAPNTDGPAALLLAERVRKALETQQTNFACSCPVTASIGVACSINIKTGWKELVKLADQAVYRVKKQGRNGVQSAY